MGEKTSKIRPQHLFTAESAEAAELFLDADLHGLILLERKCFESVKSVA